VAERLLSVYSGEANIGGHKLKNDRELETEGITELLTINMRRSGTAKHNKFLLF
jgi:hypothetical protein